MTRSSDRDRQRAVERLRAADVDGRLSTGTFEVRAGAALHATGRVGSTGDNAAMESFFSLLQKNVPDRRPWPTREDLRIAIVTRIERTYHRRRPANAAGTFTSDEARPLSRVWRRPPPASSIATQNAR